MDTNNFSMNGVFKRCAKEYQSRPVIAAKYSPGMENGFCVHYSGVGTYTKEHMLYEGIRFFLSESDAWSFINKNEKQYAMENGELVEMEVIYDEPEPVLYRKDEDAVHKDGLHFSFGKYAFTSDESEEYEFFILECNC